MSRLPNSHSYSRCKIAQAALVVVLSLGRLLAAEVVPDLRTARIEYRRDLLTALLPEKKAQLEALLTLERRLAAKSDYAGALRARDERTALNQEIMAMEHEIPSLSAQAQSLRNGPVPERTVFLAKEATLQRVTLDKKSNALTGWSAGTAFARWKLPNLPPGGYEVLVTYACPAQMSAALELKESFYFLRGTLTATNDQPLEKNIGTLRIREGQNTLTLGALKNEAGEQLKIYSVALAPANR